MIYAFITTNILVGQWLFAKAFGGTNWDEARSIIQTSDGGYAVAGYTYSFGAGDYDFLVLKLNPDGSPVWARTFGGTSEDGAYSMTQTSDGGYAVAGYTYSFGAGNADLLVLKLNPDGSIHWARTFGGTSWDRAYSITQTSDGGYAVAGHTYSFGAGDDDFLVLKLNPDGSIHWARTFGGTSWDRAYSITQTSDGGYAVAGYTYSFGAGGYDLLVLKLNPDGSLAWARTFGGTDYDIASSIAQTSDGGYAVAGYTQSFGTGGYDFLVLKLNPDGSLAWARTFGGTSWDHASSITQTSDGGYAVAGYTESFGAGNGDFLVLKLNPDGSLAWARTFGGTDWDMASSIAQTADGGYAVAGKARSFGAGDYDFLVLKLGSDGNYPGCVQECSPTVYDVSPTITEPSVGADCSPQTSSPDPTITTPDPAITEVCPTVYVRERDILPGSRITCSPVPGAALFISPYEIGIKIYKADGRLAYSGELHEGENRLPLEPGVYIWTTRNPQPVTRNQSGKLAIR
ncbi:MAG: hypothetical protein ABIN54_01040 [candidate division WOR-3 bacterium]